MERNGEDKKLVFYFIFKKKGDLYKEKKKKKIFADQKYSLCNFSGFFFFFTVWVQKDVGKLKCVCFFWGVLLSSYVKDYFISWTCKRFDGIFTMYGNIIQS